MGSIQSTGCKGSALGGVGSSGRELKECGSRGGVFSRGVGIQGYGGVGSKGCGALGAWGYGV